MHLPPGVNAVRADSAKVIQGDLNNEAIYNSLIEQARSPA